MDAGPNQPSPARTLTWLAAIAAIGFGLVAALVGLIQTQRTCFGFDDFCDGPHWGDAAIAFALATLLLATGIGLVLQLHRRRRSTSTTPRRPD
jgi:hypothetical protein